MKWGVMARIVMPFKPHGLPIDFGDHGGRNRMMPQ